MAKAKQVQDPIDHHQLAIDEALEKWFRDNWRGADALAIWRAAVQWAEVGRFARDPRHDPQPGDVVRLRGLAWDEDIQVKEASSTRVTYREVDGMSFGSCHIEDWRKRAAGKVVIKIAEATNGKG